MKKSRKLTAWVLSLVMLVSLIPGVTLTASAATTSGTTGECSWTFDDSTGTLTISGEGTMASSYTSGSQPWYAYKDSITTVIVEKGVTSISAYAFYDFLALTTVKIAGSVTAIGPNAFADTTSTAGSMTAEYYGSSNPGGTNVFFGRILLYVKVLSAYSENVCCGLMARAMLDAANEPVPSTPVTYTVTVNTSANGTVAANVDEAKEGDTVTLTVTPATGYELDTLSVKDADSGDVTVNDNKFTMPAKNVTVTATFKAVTPATYTVSFNANGGSGEMDDQTITSGVATALSENTFTRDKYTFKGWATSANGSVTYTDKESVTDLAIADGSITLYAVWESIYKNYLVNSKTLSDVQDVFKDLAEVTKTGDVITIKLLSDITGRIEFNDIGSEFVMDLNGKTVDAGSVIQEALCLNNNFSGTVTVTGNGTFTSGSNNVIYKSFSATLKFAPAEGYDCFTLKDGTRNVLGNENNFEATSLTGTYNRGTSYVLTQKILPDYTVTFDANGGSGTMASVTVKEGKKYTLPENGFTAQTGYRFAGWDKGAAGDEITVSSNTAIKAEWEKIPAETPGITSEPQGFEGADALTYGEIGTDKKLSVETDADTDVYDVTYQWYKNTESSKDGAALIGTSDELSIESNLSAGDYYYYCVVIVTRKDNGEDASVETALVKVTVDKADPLYTVPEGLEAIYGDTLLDVTLPAGWSWKLEGTMPVGETGTNTFVAVFTPEDTENYNTIEADVDISVARQKVTMPVAGATTFTYNGQSQVYKIAANDNYTVTDNTRTDAGSQTVTVSLNYPTNYEWTDGTTDDLTFNFEIGRKDISNAVITLGEELTYMGEERERDFTVAPLEGLTITYDVSGNKGINAGDYTLTLTGNGNFKGSVEKAWNIKKATHTISDEDIPSAERLVAGKPLSTSTLTPSELYDEGENLLGIFVWDDEDSTIEESGTYTKTVRFIPEDSLNYNEQTFEVSIRVFLNVGSVGGDETRYFNIQFESNGGSYVKIQNVEEGARVKEPAEPTKEGFIFDGWYTNKKLTDEYNFKNKVDEGFILYAKWVEEEIKDEDKEEDNDKNEHDCPSEAFDDLDSDAWYHSDTDFVLSEGLMKGMSDDSFEPSLNLTRAMLVTILYRLEGEPATNRSIPFSDVDMGSYYANAVSWAKQNGIVMGVTENEFAPDENVTREQIATIMFRYAVIKGMNAVTMEENLHFDDAEEISEYSISALNWAVGTGLIKGRSENTLAPKENATRAEIAAILHRFIESDK